MRVAQACAPPADPDPVGDVRMEKTGWNSSGGSESKPGWKSHDGWWAEHPLVERACVLAGRFPNPFATFAACGHVILDVRDAALSGLFAVALSSTEAPLILRQGEDAAAWSKRAPMGSAILMAFLATPSKLVGDILTTLV